MTKPHWLILLSLLAVVVSATAEGCRVVFHAARGMVQYEVSCALRLLYKGYEACTCCCVSGCMKMYHQSSYILSHTTVCICMPDLVPICAFLRTLMPKFLKSVSCLLISGDGLAISCCCGVCGTVTMWVSSGCSIEGCPLFPPKPLLRHKFNPFVLRKLSCRCFWSLGTLGFAGPWWLRVNL